MPLATRAPQTIAVANTWQIAAFAARLPLGPGDEVAMEITIAHGMTDGDQTTWHTMSRHVLAGVDLMAAYVQPPEGATLYEAIKRTLYLAAQAHGWIPADAVDT
jgi:hypothetical protein